MYCILCGAKLADTERACPLCGTEVAHPTLPLPQEEPLYPSGRMPGYKHSLFPAVLLTALWMLAAITVILCEREFGGSFAGFAVGALVVSYVALVLPVWFARRNPVIFTPCVFLTIGGYLWYINFVCNGNWYWTFALPVTGIVALLVTATVTLLRYLRGGVLYIVGGALTALGLAMLPIELLANITFGVDRLFFWCFYPLSALVLCGGVVLFAAISARARDYIHRKLFF